MLQFTRRALLVGGLATGLAACATTTPAPLPGPRRVVDLSPAELLAGINAVRKQYGTEPLVLSSSLTLMARHQVNAMVARDQMSHNFGPGLDLRARATKAGYVGPVGENVAAGQASLDETLADWLKSPGHRFTLLSNMWTSVGMVVANGRPGSRYGTFWAADFGRG